MGLMGFEGLGSDKLRLNLEFFFSVLKPPPGHPLIYTGDARRSAESQPPANKRAWVGLSIPNLQYKFTSGRFTSSTFKPIMGLRPFYPSLGFNISGVLMEVTRALQAGL